MSLIMAPLPLVLGSEHDRHDPAGEGRVRRVWGEVEEIEVVVVDLEEHEVAVDFDRSKVVLAIGVVLRREAVKSSDGSVDALDALGTERLDAAGDDDPAAAVFGAKLVVEEADLVSFEGH